MCAKYIIPSEKTRFSHPKAYIHVNVSTDASTCPFELHHEKTCLLRMRKERRKSAFYMYILFNIFLVIFTCKITSNQKIIIFWVAASWVSIYFLKQNTHISEISKSFKVCCDLRIFLYYKFNHCIVICTAFFALNAKPKILAKIIANTNELKHIPVYFITIV